MPEKTAADLTENSSTSTPEKNQKPAGKTQTGKQKAGDKRRPMKVLPNPRVSFTNQIKALRGFAAASGASNKPVTVDDVASIVGFERGTVGMLNPFFVDAGLIQSIQQKNEAWRYVPAPEVISFSRAHEWNPDTAPHKLGPLLRKAWFYDALLPKLSFAPISEDEAVGILGEKASAGPEYKKELRLLIDYLTTAGLVNRDNGNLRLIKTQSTPDNPTTAKEERPPGPDSSKHPQPSSPAQPARSSVATSFAQPTQGIVNFHVDVKVDMSEFADWSADRIASFFSGIAQVLAAKGALEKEATEE
jgi:hypothetical protein